MQYCRKYADKFTLRTADRFFHKGSSISVISMCVSLYTSLSLARSLYTRISDISDSGGSVLLRAPRGNRAYYDGRYKPRRLNSPRS